MLVNSVIDSPDSGLCMKRRVMNGCQLFTFHAAHTPTLSRQIFQQRRFASDASAYGCIIAMVTRFTHG